MRSSKSRSRSKSNRPRTLGNITNRVFDSSGPEGKVRGTPQQIIEKFGHLARDAQLSNDRVAAENFLQHAEHYTRMLAEAQREMQAEQDARQQHSNHTNTQNGGSQGHGQQGNGHQNSWRDRSDNADDGAGRHDQNRSDQARQDGNRSDSNRQDGGRQDSNRQDSNRQDGNRQDGSRQDGGRQDSNRQDANRQTTHRQETRQDANRQDGGRQDGRRERRTDSQSQVPAGSDGDVIDLSGVDDDNGLVETPEARRAPAPRETAAPEPVRRQDAFGGDAPSFLQAPAAESDVAADADADAKPVKVRRPRGPRKPKPEAASEAPRDEETRQT